MLPFPGFDMESDSIDIVNGKISNGQGNIEDINVRQDVIGFPEEAGSPNAGSLFDNNEDKLTEIIPEEVWRLVLSKLKKSNLENCTKSSPLFWNLKQNDRIFYLFPKVVLIMASVFEKRKYHMKVSNQNEQEIQEEYSIARTLTDDKIEKAKMVTDSAKQWRSTVFNCRLVCYAWDKAVENCYDRPEMTGIQELAKDFDPRSPLNTMAMELFKPKFTFHPKDGLNLPQIFLDHFEKSHWSELKDPTIKNPFFGRSIFIESIKRSENTNEYINSLFKMLSQFGDSLWYCELHVSPQEVEFDLQRFLKLMPNLKYLKLVSNVRFCPRKDFTPNSLPKLENLQVLCLEFLESPLATEIIRVNSHVKNLTFYCCEIDANLGSILKNLKGYSTSNSNGGDEILARFGKEWKLENVKISPRCIQPTQQLFSLLQNNWAETLTDVCLEHPFTRDQDLVYEESKSNSLHLPCVRRISILSEHVFFLDFLGPTNKNLEHLEISALSCYIGAKHWERVKCEQKIDWVGFKDEMNQSNIWKLFGKLKTIKNIFSSFGVSRRREMVFTNNLQKLVYSD